MDFEFDYNYLRNHNIAVICSDLDTAEKMVRIMWEHGDTLIKTAACGDAKKAAMIMAEKAAKEDGVLCLRPYSNGYSGLNFYEREGATVYDFYEIFGEQEGDLNIDDLLA